MHFSHTYWFALSAAIFLTACSGSDDENTLEPELPILTSAEQITLYEDGRFHDVIDAIDRREAKDIAGYEDLILSAKAHHAILDGIGAALELEKIADTDRDEGEYVLLLARTQLIEGQLNRAQRTLQTRQFSGGAAFEANLMLGDILSLTEDHSEALPYYNAAIELNRRSYLAFVARSQARFILGDAAGAEADAREAIALAPENTLPHYSLGNAMKAQGKMAGAKDAFERAIALNINNVPALLELSSLAIIETDYATASTYLDRVFEQSPDNPTAKFFTSLLQVLNGEDEQARQTLAELRNSNTDNIQVNRLLGHTAYRLGERDLAEDRLRLVVQRAPFDRVSRIVLAELQILSGDPGDALKTLQSVLRDGSAGLSELAMAGAAAGQLGNFQDAINYTKKTIDLAEQLSEKEAEDTITEQISSAPIPVLQRRLATFHAEVGDIDAARNILRTLIENDPSDFTSALLLNNLLVQADRYAEAENFARQIIAANPGSPIGYNSLGSIYHQQRNLESAVDHYSDAIERNPEYVSARLNRAAALLDMDRFTEAEEDLDVVLRALPDNAQLQLLYARILIDTDRSRTALGYFDSLERALPASMQVRMHHARALGNLELYGQALQKLGEAEDLAATMSDEVKKYLNDLRKNYSEALRTGSGASTTS